LSDFQTVDNQPGRSEALLVTRRLPFPPPTAPPTSHSALRTPHYKINPLPYSEGGDISDKSGRSV